MPDFATENSTCLNSTDPTLPPLKHPELGKVPAKDVIIVLFMLGLWLYSIVLIIRAWAKVHMGQGGDANAGNSMWKFVMDYLKNKKRPRPSLESVRKDSGEVDGYDETKTGIKIEMTEVKDDQLKEVLQIEQHAPPEIFSEAVIYTHPTSTIPTNQIAPAPISPVPITSSPSDPPRPRSYGDRPAITQPLSQSPTQSPSHPPLPPTSHPSLTSSDPVTSSSDHVTLEMSTAEASSSDLTNADVCSEVTTTFLRNHEWNGDLGTEGYAESSFSSVSYNTDGAVTHPNADTTSNGNRKRETLM